MNDTQTDALKKAAEELQQRINDLVNQRDAALQALENADLLLPGLETQLDSLTDGLPEEVSE